MSEWDTFNYEWNTDELRRQMNRLLTKEETVCAIEKGLPISIINGRWARVGERRARLKTIQPMISAGKIVIDQETQNVIIYRKA